PTPAILIADITAVVLDRPFSASGLWHLTAGGETSWHGFAEAIVEQAHTLGLITRRPQVTAIASSEYPTPVRRPAYSRLDCGRLQREFGIDLADWRDGLNGVLRSGSGG